MFGAVGSLASIPKSKKQRFCGFSVSDYNGTFLDHTYIAPWKVLLFINHEVAETE